MVEQRASKKQQELLSFVDGFIKGNGYGPSYREIMRALGYKSVSTVAIHVEGLIAKGYLARRDKSARSLEVVTTQPVSGARLEKKAAGVNLTEEMLIKIKDAALTAEERQAAAQIFDRLGLAEVAVSLRETNEASK